MRIKQTNHRVASFTLLALLGLCATVPFNMGGCAETTGAMSGMLGGGQLPGFGGGSQSPGASGSQAEGYLNAGIHGVQASVISDADEKAMGESVAMQVTAKYNITNNQKLNQYVALVGLTLASSTPRPDGNWFFAVIEDDQPNAFSGPDGYIFITHGAIRQMRDESELAGVLAHEMTHVLDHHGKDAAKRSGQTAALTEAAGTAMQANQQFAGWVNGGADVILRKGYDRTQEDDADAGAVKLLSTAGYDPDGYLNFLTRIADQQHGGGGMSAAFSTHPDAAGRVMKVRALIAKLPKGGAMLKERFERMVK